jgi:hypothetical protein
MTEKELLVDCLRRLNGIEISYMLTGSMVSNYWGIPRSTHDLDFVVQLPEALIPNLVDAFAGAFYIDREAIRAAFCPPYQVQRHRHPISAEDRFLAAATQAV